MKGRPFGVCSGIKNRAAAFSVQQPVFLLYIGSIGFHQSCDIFMERHI